MSLRKKYLNLGCGKKFHGDWVNADLFPADERVISCNFLNGIPFDDNSFDVVYHSHVLEHFSKVDGEKFIEECFRILKPGGILRIALPNLEAIAREYLKNLEKAESGEHLADQDYDWILLEMYDQTVRNYSGGMMANYLKDNSKNNFAYVDKRIGISHYRRVEESFYRERMGKSKSGFSISQKIKKIKHRLSMVLLSQADKQYLKDGQFRASGEIHQWMYDRYSLRRLLEKTGFKEVVTRSAIDSYINEWPSFGLDNPNETASLFMEGIK